MLAASASPSAPSLSLAQSHHAAGRRKEAEAACKALLDADPKDAGALHLLAVMAQGQKRPAVALKLARMAVAAAPHVADYHNTLGAALGDLRRWGEAAAAFRAAVALRPAYPEALLNLASALARSGASDEAEAAYRAALAHRPADVGGWRELMAVRHDRLDLPGMIECLRRVTDILPADPAAGSDLLYTLHYSPEFSRANLFDAHRAWAEAHERPVRELPGSNRPHANTPDPARRLRVGYVSGAFREHPVPRFQEADFRSHDRGRVEVVCYSDVVKPDATTRRLRGWADRWVESAGWPDEHLAERVRADGIDVLVDLTGHDVGNRLMAFARRPAPVQVTYNGYVDTTGMATMGWRITDEWHDPHPRPADAGNSGEVKRYYTERLYRMPGGMWCYTPDEDAPEVVPPPALRNGYVTFGCLNKLIKVSGPAARLWARVLERVPRSRLVLPAPAAGPTGRRRPRHGGGWRNGGCRSTGWTWSRGQKTGGRTWSGSARWTSAWTRCRSTGSRPRATRCGWACR